MNTNKQTKVNIVKEITKKLLDSKALVVANYSGVTVKQFEELRTRLREKNVDIKVYKNRLFKIAAKESGFKDLGESLVGLNVFAFGIDDDISPAKILNNFSEEFKVLKLKSGIFEGKVINEDEVKEIATLPNFEEALSMLAMQLISPIKFIGVGLNELTKDDYLNSKETKKEEVKEVAKEKEVKEEKPIEEKKEEK